MLRRGDVRGERVHQSFIKDRSLCRYVIRRKKGSCCLLCGVCVWLHARGEKEKVAISSLSLEELADGGKTVATILTRAHADKVRVDGARDAVLELEVHLGEGISCTTRDNDDNSDNKEAAG